MKAIIFGKIRCCLCGGIRGVITSVHKTGIYGEIGKRYYFHSECLELIQMEPEKFGHTLADLAIDIEDQRQENMKKENKHIQKIFREKIDKLQIAHFERMMPRQT